MSCGFVGNADIFGLGIRIGYYTQAIAVWFSNYFLYREAKDLRAVNNLFLLALTMAATIYFANASTTKVVEAFLMLQIGLVIGLVGITERSRYSSKYIKTSKERMILRMVIIIAGGMFNVCFWWREIDRMLPTPCSEPGMRRSSKHNTYIFYVLKANIYGWAGTLMKITSLAAIIWTAPKIITFDAVVLFYNIRLRKARAGFITAVETWSLSQVHRKPESQGHPKQTSATRRSPSALNGSRPSERPPGNENPNQADNVPLSEERIDSHIDCQKDDIIKDLELLRNIDTSTRYLEDLFSIYPTNAAATRKKRRVRLCGWIPLSLPQHEGHCTDKTTTYGQCCWVTSQSYFTNKPGFHLRWRLALHMTASGQHPLWRWPRLVHRMFTLGEAARPPDWRHVSIASDILLTQIPLVIKTPTWILMAAWQLLFIIVLIVQVELTIAWNNMSGLHTLATLGQLIPFILGVGGLIKVLWGKWKMISKGVEETESEEGGEYEEAMAKYLERKETITSRSVVRAATA